MAGEVEKIARLLARWHAKVKGWHAKVKGWHAFGTLARLLARWHVKMRSRHTFDTWANGHVDHAGTYGTPGTRFSIRKNETLARFWKAGTLARKPR